MAERVDSMEKVDILIQALSPEIDAKCAEIKQKKSEKTLMRVFAAAALIMLTIPALLVFFGVSLITIFIPIIFIGTVFLTASPILFSKGARVL